jgi:ATP-dependent protease ClpP protease subunit
LKHNALGKGVSMAQLIRECSDLYRSNIEKSRMLLHQKKKALTAVGSFTSKTKP